MSGIRVLDSNYKFQALLNDVVYSPLISEEINGEFIFSFNAIVDDEKSQYINYQNIIEVENNYFDIVYYKKTRNQDDTITIEVQCEHITYRLNDGDENQYPNGFAAYGTPAEIMTQLFQGTPFTVGTVEINMVGTLGIEEATNKSVMLMTIPSVFGGEFKFDKLQVSLLTRRGADRGVQFRYRKNLINCSYTVDKRTLVNGLPTISVEVGAAELEFAEGYGEDEHYELGDDVTVIDPDLDIHLPSRIVKESHNPIERMQGSVAISNVTRDIVDTITEVQATTVRKDKSYNNCSIGPKNGFVATKGDNTVRTIMNATEGISIQLSDDNGNTWEAVFYVQVVDGVPKLFLGGPAVFTGSVTGATIKTAEDGSRIEITEIGIRSYNALGQLHGLVFDPADPNAPFSLYHNGTKYYEVKRLSGGLYLSAFGMDILGFNNATGIALPFGEWDFGSAAGIYSITNWVDWSHSNNPFGSSSPSDFADYSHGHGNDYVKNAGSENLRMLLADNNIEVYVGSTYVGLIPLS